MLSFMDRLVIPQALPEKGNKVTLLLNKDIKNKVKITNKEKEDSKFILLPNGSANWKQELAVEKDCNLTATEISIIKDSFKRLESQQELYEFMLDTFEKFSEWKN